MLYDIHTPELKKIKSEGNRASFAVEPLYSGYGMTLGNSLRRVLLSSLSGAAATAVKIEGASHEFSAIDGIKEDVVEIILNLKRLRFKVYSDEPQIVTITKISKGDVTGADIQTSADVEVVNTAQHIATIDGAKTKLQMEIRVEKGRGYVPVEQREGEKLEVGMIAMDALYSPIVRVRYNVENTRVGQVTDLDKLVLEVETDGTITPEDAVAQAAGILVGQFSVVAGNPVVPGAIAGDDAVEVGGDNVMIEEINFTPRTSNALINNDIKTVKELRQLTDAELRELKGFGSKAYDEVKEKLAELGFNQED